MIKQNNLNKLSLALASVALFTTTQAFAQVAYGTGSSATGTDSVAIGTNENDGGLAEVVLFGINNSTLSSSTVELGTQNIIDAFSANAIAVGKANRLYYSPNAYVAGNSNLVGSNGADASSIVVDGEENLINTQNDGLLYSSAMSNVSGHQNILTSSSNTTVSGNSNNVENSNYSTVSGYANNVGNSQDATDKAVVIGSNSSAIGNNTVSIGAVANTSGDNSVAIGSSTNALTDPSTSTASVAIGNLAQGINGSNAIGQNAQAVNSSNALGTNAYASTSGIAVGNNTYAAFDSVAIGDSATVGSLANGSYSGAVAIGQNASVLASNSVAIGSNSSATSAYEFSVGNASTGLTRVISNVSAGVLATDAVNVGQMESYVSTAISGIPTSTSTGTGTTTGSTSTGTDTSTPIIQQNNAVQYTNAAKTDVQLSNTQIHGLAAGTSATDAVNLSQLQSANAQTLQSANNYTDQRFNSLNGQISSLRSRINGVAAMGTALSSVVVNTSANEPNMIGVGVGGYGGETGFALVYAHTFSNTLLLNLRVGGSTGGGGVAVGGGISKAF